MLLKRLNYKELQKIKEFFNSFRENNCWSIGLIDDDFYEVQVSLSAEQLLALEELFSLGNFEDWYTKVFYDSDSCAISFNIDFVDDRTSISLTDYITNSFKIIINNYYYSQIIEKNKEKEWLKTNNQKEKNNQKVESKVKQFFTAEHLRKICIDNNWFTCGSNSQYDKLFKMNEDTISTLHDMAFAIYMCSEDTTIEEVENILNKELKLTRTKAEFDPIRLLAELHTGVFNFREDTYDNAFDFYLTDEIAATVHRDDRGKIVIDGFKYTDEEGKEWDLY